MEKSVQSGRCEITAAAASQSGSGAQGTAGRKRKIEKDYVDSDHVDPAFRDVDPPAKQAIRVRAVSRFKNTKDIRLSLLSLI
jgi:hypothetical protein